MDVGEICPISGSKMGKVFNAEVLNKYKVDYYYSEDSGLLKTEKPYWLDEAYESAIAGTDIGLLDRNIKNSKRLESMLYLLFPNQSCFVDVSGGYGLLTRALRDKGFNAFWTDKYCENMFAEGFDAKEVNSANCLFAFEVLEHIEDPVEFLKDAFIRFNCENILFSTEVFKGGIPSNSWWYYSFETGQHISFYQTKTLEKLAHKLGCSYAHLGNDLHFIGKTKIKAYQKFIFTNRYLRLIYSSYVKIRRSGLSRMQEDYQEIKSSLKKC